MFGVGWLQCKDLQWLDAQQFVAAAGRGSQPAAADRLWHRAAPRSPCLQVPRGPGSPPVPVMHSPPRPLTVKDQQDWKIPPCISNWKNSKVGGWVGGWGNG